MKIIKFKITGNGALLMHNPASMRGNRGAQRGATSIPEPYDEAKAGLYVNGGHQLYLKSDAFREAALTAAKSFKAPRGRGTLVNTLAAAVFLACYSALAPPYRLLTRMPTGKLIFGGSSSNAVAFCGHVQRSPAGSAF